MHWKLFVFVLVLVGVNFLESRSINCPSFCICDMVDNLRRTACTNGTIAVIEYDVPKEVQFLDMSYNHISTLNENVFIEMQVTNLKILNVSHNHIFNVHMNAFNGLTKLKTMDLSYNFLRYILPEWTRNLVSLQELYLRGNNLKDAVNHDVFRTGKIFESKTLKVLDLSQCGIISIKNGIFSDLPKLEKLDLSNNRLKRIKLSIVAPLKNLLIFNLKDNMLDCKNWDTNATVNYLKAKGIRNENSCLEKKKPSGSKFERLIEAPMTIPKNFWLYEDDDQNSNNTANNTIISPQLKTSHQSLIETIFFLSPWLFVFFLLLSGLLIGLILGCSITIPDEPCCTCSQFIASLHIKSRRSLKKTRKNISRSLNNLRRLSRNFSNPGNNEFNSTLLASEFDLSFTTPTFQRRQLPGSS